MTLLHDFKLIIDADRVLRCQGADPAVIRKRSPRLLEAAERALEMGLPLVQPMVAFRELKVKHVQHERLLLSEGGSLSGKTVLKLLAPARKVVVMVCTIGPALEMLVSSILPADPSLGLALDGVGTAAVEALTVAACSYFGDQAKVEGYQSTIPLSPGMEGWPADKGQKQIFTLVPPEEAGVRVTDSGMMVPQKSLSLVIGLGRDLDDAGRVCDYCSVRNTCRHQEHYD